jgi:hypothetical protein
MDWRGASVIFPRTKIANVGLVSLSGKLAFRVLTRCARATSDNSVASCGAKSKAESGKRSRTTVHSQKQESCFEFGKTSKSVMKLA